VSGAILGIDLGSRRVGVALAEPGDLAARPLTTLPRAAAGPSGDEGLFRALAVLVQSHGVGEIVVGLPLEAGGAEGPMASEARTWAATAGAALGVSVTLRDERLSSHLAEERLGRMPRGRSGGPPSPTQRQRYRERVDREAAAIILQDELDARRSTNR
jgi:putative Holliday junction resolvase